ncbi:hypothetical protein LCGC14_0373460 [marine sediment metagenome]|uniref:Uncharacterized protein n=1 Tax=marine sediment metagenome TaxID=412755 RepID=A0A0F9VRP3_9ZZZZ
MREENWPGPFPPGPLVVFPRTIKEHQANVRALRCVVTANPYPTIHHCHGGSMKLAGYNTGMAQRGVGEALIIPLKADYHIGDEGIDFSIGVTTWELWFGTQMEHLEDINQQLPYNIWDLHKAWIETAPPRGR